MSLRPRRITPWIARDASRRQRSPLRSEAEAVVALIASRQAGVVARWQLLEAGLTADEIRSRVARGLLHVVVRGVYAVGQRALSPAARYWVAVLACGPGALLGGRSAAEFAGVVPPRPSLPVTVVVPPQVQRSPPGVRVRRLRITARERTEVSGLGAMILPRAILETAATDGAQEAERVWRGCVHHGLLDVEALIAVLEAHDGEPGTPIVRALLDRRLDLIGAAQTGLEERVAGVVVAAGLPVPARNVRVVLSSGRVAWFDLCIADLRLAIEADGPYHDDPEVAADDAVRDAEAAADGWCTVRGRYDESDEVIGARVRATAARLESPLDVDLGGRQPLGSTSPAVASARDAR